MWKEKHFMQITLTPYSSLKCIIRVVLFRFIARFPMESALTIMVETGVQNNLIAISMIKLSYPQPEADLMARMPIFVAISSITIGLIMICLSIPINRKRRAERKQKAEEIKELDDRLILSFDISVSFKNFVTTVPIFFSPKAAPSMINLCFTCLHHLLNYQISSPCPKHLSSYLISQRAGCRGGGG